MNNSLKIFLAAAGAIFVYGGASAQSVLSVSDASLESSLIMPESCETNTKTMLEDWYLKNYIVLDYEADKKNTGKFDDDLLIERLGKLPTVIEMPFNSLVKSAIRYYANRPQLVENMLGLSLYYMPIFEAALERHKMPLELKYLPVIESALVPTAVSKAGAGGLWQFMPPTAKGLGLEINSLVDQRRDPYLASDAAARYLKQLYQTYDDWSLAIAAYNCGPGNVNKALRRAGDGKHDFWEIYPFLPPETRGYVPTFIAANYIMNYHKDHNISPALARRPLVTDTVHVTRRVHFDQISQVMDIPVAELRALNPQFRTDLIPGDIRPYSLVLPSLQAYAYIVNEDSIVNHNATKYSRRGVVEPASGASTGRDSKGEYYDEEVVKWHTVKKGETLSKIARKYGVSVADIRKYNRVGKSVKAGKKLKIVSTRRVYKPKTEEIKQETPVQVADTAIIAPVEHPDSVSAATPDSLSVAGSVEAAFSAPKEEKKVEEKPRPAPKPQQTQAKPQKKQEAAAPRVHRVRKGENLSKIAARYGTTVDKIKKANNLKNNNIQAGQRLSIP
ncbi:MAG: LysM peptidoglycan-binding domain-containing protein [Muribaculaceae bacterium]|nr:LysM peptidoglycan-binding domain-containing protein [Muribaculaceae bacterium]